MDSLTILHPRLWDDVTLSPSMGDALSTLAANLQDGRRDDLDKYKSPNTAEDVYTIEGNDYYWPSGNNPSMYLFDLSPTEETCLDAFFDRYGGSLVGYGTGRITITLPCLSEMVVKLGRWGTSIANGHGVQQNQFEVTLFKEYRETHSPPLLPITAVEDTGDWLLCPRVTVLEQFAEDNLATAHRVRRDVKASVESLNQHIHFEEFEFHNLGLWEGDWYVIDYGRPQDEDEGLKRIEAAACW